MLMHCLSSSKREKNKVIRLLTILLFLPTLSWSQTIKATIDKNRILIGDHINLYLEINPSDGLLENVDIGPLNTFDSIEVVDPGKDQKRENSAIIDRQIIITSFDSGAFYIPSLTALIKSPSGEMDAVSSNQIPIYVNTVQPDSMALAPLKDIVLEEMIWKDYIMYFLPIIILGLMILFLWYWNKRKNDEFNEQVIEAPPIPADKLAISQFDNLESKNLYEEGHQKEYEAELSEILRRYVENKFEFPALEWTTREIVKELSSMNIEGMPLTILQDTLEQSDMVKFAKAKPGPQVHQARVRKCIKHKW